MRRTTLFALLAGLAAALVAAAATPAAVLERTDLTRAEQRAQTTTIQILGFNDLHGTLEPGRWTIAPSTSVPAGGVEYLATHIERLEATNPNTLVVHAGDMVGASPLLSALFHDEPTIEAANLLGMDFASVGNHEFDEGLSELRRLQNGGCHPVDGCQDGDGFAGASFRYLAANVVEEATGETIFPPYAIVHFRGVKIALVGVTLEGTPTIVTPAGVAGLEFADEAETINALVPELKRKNVETIVVLIHQGGSQSRGGFYNDCVGISGEIVDIVTRTHDEVDAFVSGHTHQAYNCVIDGRPVTQAGAFGRILSDLDLVVSRATKEVAKVTTTNHVVTTDVPADPAQTSLLAKYRRLAAPLANRVIGSIAADITRTTTAAGESALGDVIADAQLAATSHPGMGEAQIAFMNPGGIRADLRCGDIAGGEAPCQVTYGEAFTVQPFGNSLVTMTLTGAQIERVLEQQFGNPAPGQNTILQVSHGFAYTWDASRPEGDRVDPASITLNGVALSPSANYRVTVNSFLAEGGDRFTVLREGMNRLGGDVDLDALVAYFGTHSPVPPGPLDRINRVG